MEFVDLTHPIRPGMTLFPGTPEPELTALARLETDGYRETALRLTSHTGTHMDAPAHLLPDGRTLDEFSVSAFCGRAIALDASRCGGSIGMEVLRPHMAAVEEAEFVLFSTGWARLWGTAAYGREFPVLTPEAAAFLAGKKGVGFDTLSADPADDAALPRHHLLLGAGTLIVENLTGLEQLLDKTFAFYALPLRFDGADGAPVRAIAQIL